MCNRSRAGGPPLSQCGARPHGGGKGAGIEPEHRTRTPPVARPGLRVSPTSQRRASTTRAGRVRARARQVPLPGSLSARPASTLRSHVAAVAVPARDRTVHCSIGVNAAGPKGRRAGRRPRRMQMTHRYWTLGPASHRGLSKEPLASRGILPHPCQPRHRPSAWSCAAHALDSQPNTLQQVERRTRNHLQCRPMGARLSL